MQDKICDSFLVHDFFITDLGLSGVELLTFSLVYSFCRRGLGSYYGSVGYLRKRLGICERSVQRSLCALVEKGLLAKNTSPLRSIPHYSITDAVIEARERRLNSKLQEESGLWEQTIKGKNDGDGVQDIRPLGDNAAGGRWQGDTQDNISDKIEDNINSNNTNYPSFCKAHTCVKLDRENEDVAFGSFGRPEGEEEGWEHSALLTDEQQENDCTSGGGGQIGLSHRRGNDGTAGGGGQTEHSRDRLAKAAGRFGDGLAGNSYYTEEVAYPDGTAGGGGHRTNPSYYTEEAAYPDGTAGGGGPTEGRARRLAPRTTRGCVIAEEAEDAESLDDEYDVESHWGERLGVDAQREIKSKKYRVAGLGEYGLVELTDKQYIALLRLAPAEIIDRYIRKIENYISYPGKGTVHNPYRTILRWLKQDFGT